MKTFILLIAIVLCTVNSALAGQGWYLMEPEMIKKEDGTYSYPVSMSRWTQLKAFETSKACEKEHKSLEEEAFKALRNLRAEDEKSADKSINDLYEKRMMEIGQRRCITSDDPRLKP
ncbi:MAG: hypothetical protein ACYDBV_02585 [Nitrospiria bacterium]